MATTLLQIGYRPLRLCFLVRPNSLNDVMRSIQLCSLLWGGSFNPILPVTGHEVDHDIAALGVDGLLPVADTASIAAVIERHPHLRWNFFQDGLTDERGLLVVQDIAPMLQMLERRWRESSVIQPVVLPRAGTARILTGRSTQRLSVI